MTVAKLRPSLHDRVTDLEKRADGHDKMVEQFSEIYIAFKNAKIVLRIFNRLSVKALAGLFALIGAAAAVLTIWERASALFGHH